MNLLAAALAALALVGEPAAVTAEALLAAPDPGRVDYYALKSQLGARGLMELRNQTLAVLQGRGIGYLGPGCISANQARVLTGLVLAAESKTPEAFSADRAAGEALFARESALWPRLQAGEDLGPQYKEVAAALRRSAAATDPRLRELFARLARDQFVRISNPATVRSGPDGIADLPAFYAGQVGMTEWCEVDLANTAWLKAQLKDHGWFKLSRYGQEADTAAFLIVQHADRDRAFQRERLGVLEKLVAEKETRPRSYA